MNDRGGSIFTYRGLTNLGCLTVLVILLLALLFVFLLLNFAPYLPVHVHSFNSAGYPIITFLTRHPLSRQGGFNLGGTNSSGQVRILI